MSTKRLAYTKEEDDRIWTYVNVTNKDDGVWGKTLWRKLVATGLLPGRTVDSLRVTAVLLLFAVGFLFSTRALNARTTTSGSSCPAWNVR
jgi:hypothetical protein